MKLKNLLWAVCLFFICLNILGAEEFNIKHSGQVEIHYTDKHTKLVEHTTRLVNDSLEELDAQVGLRLQGRLKLVIMPSRKAFEAKLSPQMRSWTLAFALIKRAPQSRGGTIVINPSSLDLRANNLLQTLKHELWHILIHEATDDIPKWFDEGVAQWISDYSIFESKTNELRMAALSNNLIPLAELTDDFPQNLPAVKLAYIQSESVVRYIAEQYGASSIKDIIYSLQKDADFPTALRKATRTTTAGLEANWYKQFQPNLFNLFMLAFTQRNIFIMIGLMAVLAFFIVRSRRKKRLKTMAEEDAWMQSLESSEWGPTEYEEDEE
ncbi:peptidase MA family metallohydrolase [Planctomycetota bacterium]